MGKYADAGWEESASYKKGPTSPPESDVMSEPHHRATK